MIVSILTVLISHIFYISRAGVCEGQEMSVSCFMIVGHFQTASPERG